jgi:hypothetical protein
VIAYRAMLDVPRELAIELATLLRAERRARGTRKGTRLLTCFKQALLVLVWLRTTGDVEVVGAGFGRPARPPTATVTRASRCSPRRLPTCTRPCRWWPSRDGRTSCSTAR